MSGEQFRVVLDTNQIVAAGTGWLDRGQPAPNPNTSRRILIRVAETHLGLYCGKIVGEYLEKLVDLGHPPRRAVRMMAYIMGAFVRVEIFTEEAPFRPIDLDDEVFLLCAIDGEANYLVSEDQGLLDLDPNYPDFVIGRSDELAALLAP